VLVIEGGDEGGDDGRGSSGAVGFRLGFVVWVARETG
ncbi:hypothetical protein Tco_0260886, partial [Tanacetum coccineum]